MAGGLQERGALNLWIKFYVMFTPAKQPLIAIRGWLHSLTPGRAPQRHQRADRKRRVSWERGNAKVLGLRAADWRWGVGLGSRVSERGGGLA